MHYKASKKFGSQYKTYDPKQNISPQSCQHPVWQSKKYKTFRGISFDSRSAKRFFQHFLFDTPPQVNKPTSDPLLLQYCPCILRTTGLSTCLRSSTLGWSVLLAPKETRIKLSWAVGAVTLVRYFLKKADCFSSLVPETATFSAGRLLTFAGAMLVEPGRAASHRFLHNSSPTTAYPKERPTQKNEARSRTRSRVGRALNPKPGSYLGNENVCR